MANETSSTDAEILIWGRASSANVQKVLWALGELGHPFRRIDAGGRYGVVDTPEYGRLNPNRRVPTLQQGSLTLWESNAIVRYLARRYGGVLQPAGEAESAIAEQWMDWAATTFTPAFTGVFWQVIRFAPDERDAAELARQHERLMAAAAIADAHLAQTRWLGGEHFSMADIPVGATMYRYFDMPIERIDTPHLRRWYEALGARTAYRATVMTSYDELRGLRPKT
ncbi:MAG: glutathione S-transferase N-terminal domain-containing protein [Burkholderiaceae bacterium]